MKALIITVAGLSTRFSRSVGRECLKCIYYEKSFEDTLLYQLIHKNDAFDKFIIVGGYKFSELENAVQNFFKDIRDKIILVKNPFYADYGSGYSLYLGLKSAIDIRADEVVFAEGDLWTDEASFSAVINSDKNVITFNRETIEAKKSVVFYFDANNSVHYIYDTSHNCLKIEEGFLSVYNSGQIWKFKGNDSINRAVNAISEDAWHGTNLVFIQEYFKNLSPSGFDLIELKKWFNCNTVNDFKNIGE